MFKLLSFLSIQPASQPFSVCLSSVRLQYSSRLSKVSQTFLSPATLSRSSCGGSWGIPRPDDICHPSSKFWVCPGGLLTVGCAPEKPPKGSAREDLDQMPEPPQPARFGANGPAALLQAPLWMSEFINRSLNPATPLKKPEFAISFFQSLPKSLVHIWVFVPVNWKLHLHCKLPRGLLEVTDCRGLQIYVIC